MKLVRRKPRPIYEESFKCAYCDGPCDVDRPNGIEACCWRCWRRMYGGSKYGTTRLIAAAYDAGERNATPTTERLPTYGPGLPAEHGERRCNYSADGGASSCGAVATFHAIELDPDDGDYWVAWCCDAHIGVWKWDDQHPLGADCGMPGSNWHTGTPSYCRSDDLPITDAVAEKERGGGAV